MDAAHGQKRDFDYYPMPKTVSVSWLAVEKSGVH